MDYTPIFCKFRTPLPTLKEHYFLKFVNKRKILCDLIKNAAKNLEFILKISIDLVIIITVEHRTQSCFFVEQVTLRKIGRAYVLFFLFLRAIWLPYIPSRRHTCINQQPSASPSQAFSIYSLCSSSISCISDEKSPLHGIFFVILAFTRNTVFYSIL